MDEKGSLFMPAANSTIAGDVDALFNFILYASVVIFVIVVAVTVYFLFKYRRKGKRELTSGVDHNLKLEIFWTIIPTILVFIVFFWGFNTFLKMNVSPGDALEIKVTGQKWFWTFDYPNGSKGVNELIVPEGKPVKLLLSSTDVIHSFFVPEFRLKMDAVPNRYTMAWFEATAAGEYNIFCTEYCGKGHSEMLGKVKVLSEEDYEKWLTASSVDIPEGMSLEEAGKELFVSRACNTCHSIDGSAGIAPTFKGVFGKTEQFTDGTEMIIDENYLRKSILNPQAQIVAGYPPVMPTYQGVLTDRQVDALIVYIKSLK